MKAQCERCKEIVPLEFALDRAGIRVTCPSCKGVYFVASTREPAPPPVPVPAPAAGEIACPKCGEGHPRATESCRRCGLVFANWDPDASGELTIGEVKEAAALWNACVEGWDDGARHDAFIDHCRRSGVLAFAAGRYRKVGPREGAAERLQQIRILAEHTLAVAPRSPAPPPRKLSLGLGIAVVVVMLLVGYAMLQMLTP